MDIEENSSLADVYQVPTKAMRSSLSETLKMQQDLKQLNLPLKLSLVCRGCSMR